MNLIILVHIIKMKYKYFLNTLLLVILSVSLNAQDHSVHEKWELNGADERIEQNRKRLAFDELLSSYLTFNELKKKYNEKDHIVINNSNTSAKICDEHVSRPRLLSVSAYLGNIFYLPRLIRN